MSSAALANWSSVWIFLLAPVVIVGGFLVWQLDPGREFFGWIIGLALLPALVAIREPPCATFDSCSRNPGIMWLSLLLAVALVLIGLVVTIRPAVTQPDEASTLQ